MSATTRPPTHDSEYELIRMISADQIEKLYRAQTISLERRNDLMRRKAWQVEFDTLDQLGVPSAYVKETVRNFNEGWEKAAAAWSQLTAETEPNDPKWQTVQFAIGSLQVLTSSLAAAGAVGGDKVEQVLIGMGVDPGAARVANIGTRVGVEWGPLMSGGAKGLAAILRVPAKAKGAESESLVSIKQALDDGFYVSGLSQMGGESVSSLKTDITSALDTAFGKAAGATSTQYQLPSIRQTVNEVLSSDKYAMIPKPLRESLPSKVEEEMAKIYGVGKAKPASPAIEAAWNEAWGRSVGELGNMPTSQMGIPGVKQQITDAVEREAKAVSNENARRIVTQIAKKEGIDLEELYMATNYTTKQMYAYLSILKPHSDELSKLAKAAATGTTEDQLKFAKFASDLFTASPGREKVPYMNYLNDILKEWSPENMAKGDVQAAIKEFAQDLSVLEPDKLRNLALKAQDINLKNISGGAPDPGGWAKVKDFYRNMLLPFAWNPTFVGNSITTGIYVTERAVGGIVEKGPVAGIEDAYNFNKALTLAFGNALNSFKEGYKSTGPGGTTRFDTVQAIGHDTMAGRLMNVPQDLVKGMDNVHNQAIKQAVITADAIAWGRKQGLKGEELGNFVRDKVNFPTEAMLERGNTIGQEITMNTQLGYLGGQFQRFAQWGPLFLWAPMMKSYINLAKYSWARTPILQSTSVKLFQDIAAGGAAGERAVGQLITSNLFGMYVYQLAKEGYITGSGPTDPIQRNAWLKNNQPNSIKTPLGWMPLGGYDPVFAPIRFMANLAQIADQLDEPTLEQAFMGFAMATVNSYATNNWWKTGGDLFDAVQGLVKGGTVGEAGVKLLTAPLATLTSGGVVGGRIEQAIDPVWREADGWLQEIQAKMPGFSPGLNPVVDDFGDPRTAPTSPVNSWFGVFRPLVPVFKDFENDPVKIEASKVGAKLPNVQEKSFIRGLNPSTTLTTPEAGRQISVQGTEDELRQRRELYSQLWRDPKNGIQAQLLNTIDYSIDRTTGDKTTTAQRAAWYSEAMHSYWKDATDRTIANNPLLQERMLKARAAKERGFVGPSEMPAFEQGVKEEQQQIEMLKGMTQQERQRFLNLDGPREVPNQ